MSWTTGNCKCGNTVDYGIYYSEQEVELSEINVTVICGECVRERDGIPSEEILDAEFEVFKSEVEKHGLRDVINWDVIEGQNRKVLEMVCVMYESDEDNSETYAGSAWSILNT